ncbi:MAG: amidase, partial [Massilia sp.]|nr:amidase [Massilia sp.]
MTLRRDFLIKAPLGLLAAGTAATTAISASAQTGTAPPPGAPPTFGAMPAAGPEVTPATFAEAEKLMRVTMTPAQRTLAARSWRVSMAAMQERRTGPNKLAIADKVAPATVWRPLASGVNLQSAARFIRSSDAPALPALDADIAFAPVTHLSRWIAARQLSSERLTRIYLERIARLDGKLRSVITVTLDHAIARARQADAEIAAGKYRGPLHGIPYGVKDLLDTAGIATTWGAEPMRNNVPARDSAVVARLNAAGAVLIAKLSLGALALNDIWFGGQTMNPWLLEEGASGSSAGPGAATAAGLVGFSIGSETGGSIVSPSMRCGVTGLRPTYGRVARNGAMTLCWSLDKLGPMTRGVEDAMLVLAAINGSDKDDVASVDVPLAFDAGGAVRGLKIG